MGGPSQIKLKSMIAVIVIGFVLVVVWIWIIREIKKTPVSESEEDSITDKEAKIIQLDQFELDAFHPVLAK
jgi:flagellar biosynthesis/type III secretory pathway M-ring protein FliF/YscJ